MNSENSTEESTKGRPDFIFWSVFILSFLGLSFLRFYNLGYSNFIPDETTVMAPIRDGENVFSKEFILAQNKGPAQFVLAFLTSLLVKSPFNEAAFRLPFSLFNIFSLILLFLYIKNISQNKWAALMGTALFGVNGVIVAFGRIVQYQSLNLFFTILSLYLLEIYSRKKQFKYALVGILAFTASFLSHWDALFGLPLIGYYVIKGSGIKRVLGLVGIAIFSVFPFGIPFARNLSNRPEFIDYISSRVGFNGFRIDGALDYYAFFAKLYNPFFFLPFFIAGSILVLFFCWRRWPYYLWFIFHLIIFGFFVRRSGTHLYNILLPFSILLSFLVVRFPEKLRRVVVPAFLVFSLLLGYQSYILFADVSNEYPWQRETLLGIDSLKTIEYTHENLTNNILGFPINRRWNRVREFINEHEATTGEKSDCYYTNGSTSIGGFYLDREPKIAEGCYLVAVKEPLNFVNDRRFPQVDDRKLLANFKDTFGRTMSKLYLITKLEE